VARTFEIHPSIGIARLGTSAQFFLGPEPGVDPPERYRDNSGALKRQAARFRVFECDRAADGTLTSATEIDATAGATIAWTVHLANRKAAAPAFATPAGGRRNHATGNDVADAELLIDPGPRDVSGVSVPPVRFDTGTFMQTPVFLGDIRTDASGRLLVCGGHGISDSVPAQPNPARPIQGFADSNGWYDDIADGPVTAAITLANGTQVQAESAWVIVGPPDFAPEITNLVTLYDVAFDVAVAKGMLSMPVKPSFVLHIQPTLARAPGYQWVNRFAVGGHSGNRPGNFAFNWAALADPANPPDEAAIVLERLRDSTVSPVPDPAETNARLWMPRLHDENNDHHVLPVTKAQYTFLKQWAAGDFIGDLNAAPAAELLPVALDRLALQGCSGGAFFPGIEAGRIMKDPALYKAPFRLNAAALKPGQITAGNALPWQADFHACAWEGSSFIGWWPAQRPDHVRPESNPTVFMNWDRGITGVLDNGDRDMIDGWSRLGIVRRRVTTAGEVFVETERDPTLP
jgi:L-lysine epsilon oxidase-like protein